jgi:hypothetical protein
VVVDGRPGISQRPERIGGSSSIEVVRTVTVPPGGYSQINIADVRGRHGESELHGVHLAAVTLN